MATYSILNVLGAGITSPRFFQTGDGGSLMGWDSTFVNVQNPDGTIVAIVGTGIVLTDIGGGEMVPTAGTITDITLYQADFTTQLAGFSGLSVAVVDLYNVWQVTFGNVFNLLLSGNDTVTGSDGNDALFGAAGNDTLSGGIGDDYLEPGRGTDTVNGGDGTRDILGYANASNDPAVTKGATVDLSMSTIIDPWGNADTIFGIEGVRGTKYADTLSGNVADNRFEPLGGNDVIDGGAGIDQIRYNRDLQYGGALGVVVNLDKGTGTDGFGNLDTFSNIEAVVGTDADDTLTGGNTPLANNASYEIYGLGGHDTITAGSWDLYVEPGAGNDTITGGAGSDQVSYSEYTGSNGATFDLSKNTITDPYGGTDTLSGSIEGIRGTRNADTATGNDLNNYFRSLAGNDLINGGGGTDQVRYDRDAQFGGTKGVTVNLALGKATDGFGDIDTLISIESVRGSNQADTLTGDGLANVFQGLGGDDTIDGGDGLDVVEYGADAAFGGTAGVTVNLATGKATDGFGNTDTLTSIETVRGTAKNDTLTGGNTPLAGTDIYTLTGLEGDDTLTAGSYDSLLSPGAGNDIVAGGAGFDQISYDEYTGANGATINLATGVVADPFGGTDTVSGVEGVRGTRNADTITGNDGNNFFRGMAGGDTINGGGGIDQVRYDRDVFAGGGAGVSVDLAAKTATDGFGTIDTLIAIENVRGSNQADTLTGDGLANVFQGLGGVDTIDGGAGIDTMDFAADAGFGGTAGVSVNLGTGKATDGFGNIDTLLNVENVIGTRFADTLTGDGADNVLTGGAGNDFLTGGDGNDTAVFSGPRENYRIGVAGEWVGVSGPDGTDYAKGVEQLQFGASAPISLDSLRGQPGTHELMSFITSGQLIFALPLDYSGPLNLKYVYPGTDNDDVVAGTVFNDFMNLAGGNDAVQMGAGDDIVDGGGGNNFLSGDTGRDTFFLDGRFHVPVWSCITDWEAGESLTLWGWTAGVSTASWAENQGLPGYLGATMFADIDGNGLVETAITWAGKTIADLPVGVEGQVSGIGVLTFG